MKIALLEIGGWGGIWHYTCCLGEALAQQGLEVFVITKPGYEKPFEFHFRVVPILFEKKHYLSHWNRIYRFLRKEKPQLFHVQSWLTARRDWLPLMILNKCMLPLIVTAHNLLPHDCKERNALFMHFAYGRIYHSAAGLIAHSNANKEELIRTFQLPAQKIEVIRHGSYLFFSKRYCFDPMLIRSQYLNIERTKKVFLIFGALRHYKGIDLALKAFAAITNRESMHLIIAGKPYGAILNELKKTARELRIADQITFLPDYLPDEEVAKLHILADIVLFPYRDIFQSGALQIALAFGKPVIASRSGAFPETLSNKNAWFVRPGSVEDLTLALEQSLSVSNADLQLMGTESRRIAIRDQDWLDISGQTARMYLKILGNHIS